METYKSLIPGHAPREDSYFLNDKSLPKDITLKQWFDLFTKDLSNYDWKWPGAKADNIQGLFIEVAMDFCSDPEAIRHRQELLLVFANITSLSEFYLYGIKPYEKWKGGTNEESHLLMLSNFELLVAECHNRFDRLGEIEKGILKPYIDYIMNLNESEVLTNLRRFLSIYHKPIEFELIFGEELFGYNWNREKRIATYKSYPSDSLEVKKLLQEEIPFQISGCRIFDGSTIINIKDEQYLIGETRSNLQHINAEMMLRLLSVGYVDFLEYIIPRKDQPLAATMRFESVSKKETISLKLKEFEHDSVLQVLHRAEANDPVFTTVPRSPSNKPKTERNDLQKKLLQREAVPRAPNTVRAADEWQSPYGLAKISFFYSYVAKMQQEVTEFGKFLSEMRYFAFSASQFAICSLGVSGATFPKILPVEDNYTSIEEARNPTLLIDPEIKVGVVSNDVRIDQKRRVQLITGPNQNGKSRYMDLIGLSQIMFQAGWPLFAKSATMSPKTDLRVHYVHSGVGIPGESRFSHECERMRNVIESARGAYPLFLLDESYTGTNHEDASILLKEILQACSEEDVTLVMTTHVHEVISYVDSLHNGVNLHCVIGDDGSFTYKIRDGSSTKTNALSVAEKAGVRYPQLVEIIRKNKAKPLQLETGSEENVDLPF